MRHDEPRYTAGIKSQPSGYSYESRLYEQFQVIFVSSGVLYFTVHDQDVTLEPGSVLVLREGSVFRLHTRESGYGGVFFSAFNDPRQAFRGPAAACLADRGVQEIAGMMQREMMQPGIGSQDVLTGLGRVLAWRAIRQVNESATSTETTDYARYWTDLVRETIHANLYNPRPVKELLGQLNLSYRQLSRYFTQRMGMTPKEYQIRARVIEAQRLLTGTALPVTTIAFELGYPSSQHFATQFKELTGRSPSRYRAMS